MTNPKLVNTLQITEGFGGVVGYAQVLKIENDVVIMISAPDYSRLAQKMTDASTLALIPKTSNLTLTHLTDEEWAEAIDEERLRQINEKGYTPESDRKKGPYVLLAEVMDYARRGETLKAAALAKAVADLLDWGGEGVKEEETGEDSNFEAQSYIEIWKAVYDRARYFTSHIQAQEIADNAYPIRHGLDGPRTIVGD